jgi:alkyl hydroperoxide reductase subunit F
MYDLVIIGGGPAGVSAGVYAARKKIKTAFITGDFESQSVVSEKIENWIGTPAISGADLAKNLKKHLLEFSADSVKLFEGEWVKDIIKNETDKTFQIVTDKNTYTTKTILIASGSHRRKLEVKGADIFEHKGLTYCASCDGPLFTGQDVAVVGGGNAAFETAAQLMAYCKSVTILNRTESFRADPVTVEKVLSFPNVKAIKNAIPAEITGEKFVKSLIYTDALTKESFTLNVTGIFAEIGSLPNTDFAKNVIELTAYNQVVTDPRNQRTKTEGIWAAGDCTDGLYHQNNIAAGDGVKALEDIYLYLYAKKS